MTGYWFEPNPCIFKSSVYFTRVSLLKGNIFRSHFANCIGVDDLKDVHYFIHVTHIILGVTSDPAKHEYQIEDKRISKKFENKLYCYQIYH